MRIAILWVVLATAAGVFVAMLVALRHHRAHVTTSAPPEASAEYVWTVIPWLVVALCVAPAVHRLLAPGEGELCRNCHLAEGMAQPPAYPPIAMNECTERLSAVGLIRTALNCGHSP